MRILITGGCGFIGANLVNLLLDYRDFDITILDNLSTGRVDYLSDVLRRHGVKSSDIRFINGDVRDKYLVNNGHGRYDIVVHLAANAGVIRSIKDPFHDLEVNVLGTLNLLNASLRSGVEKFIFASSNAPIGNQSYPMNEKKPPKPLSPYGASKLSGEGYCSAYYGSYGLQTVVLRFSNAYGPYCLHKNSVVAKFIRDGILERKLTIYGDGAQTRDFVYVDDICRAILGVIESKSETIYGETFHLGTGKETKIIELAEIVRNVFNYGIQIRFDPPRKGEIQRNYSDISKISKELGFFPEMGLRDGVTKVFNWFSGQGEERINFSRAVSGSE
jgi:UDP-glucose 4-epimerase